MTTHRCQITIQYSSADILLKPSDLSELPLVKWNTGIFKCRRVAKVLHTDQPMFGARSSSCFSSCITIELDDYIFNYYLPSLLT